MDDRELSIQAVVAVPVSKVMLELAYEVQMRLANDHEFVHVCQRSHEPFVTEGTQRGFEISKVALIALKFLNSLVYSVPARSG